jgi:hypothetical protein
VKVIIEYNSTFVTDNIDFEEFKDSEEVQLVADMLFARGTVFSKKNKNVCIPTSYIKYIKKDTNGTI